MENLHYQLIDISMRLQYSNIVYKHDQSSSVKPQTETALTPQATHKASLLIASIETHPKRFLYWTIPTNQQRTKELNLLTSIVKPIGENLAKYSPYRLSIREERKATLRYFIDISRDYQLISIRVLVEKKKINVRTIHFSRIYAHTFRLEQSNIDQSHLIKLSSTHMVRILTFCRKQLCLDHFTSLLLIPLPNLTLIAIKNTHINQLGRTKGVF